MRRWTIATAGLGLVLSGSLLAGCGGAAEQPAPAPASAASSAAAPSDAATPDAQGTPGVQATPGTQATPGAPSASGEPCPAGQPTGPYALEQFAGQGADVMGSGKGGDITVTFTDGRYRMAGQGREPMTIALQNGSTGELRMDGTIDGAYATSGATRKFTVSASEGTAKISSGGQQAALPIDQVAAVIGLNGEFAVACSGDRLAIAGTSAVFSLAKA